MLVVAADDGVMPQTIEAIDHARAAGVPMIVAINKMDKPDAIRTGCATICCRMNWLSKSSAAMSLEVEVSALKSTNLDKLWKRSMLQAECSNSRPTPIGPPKVLSSKRKLDKGRGSVATVLVQRGTLKCR